MKLSSVGQKRPLRESRTMGHTKIWSERILTELAITHCSRKKTKTSNWRKVNVIWKSEVSRFENRLWKIQPFEMFEMRAHLVFGHSSMMAHVTVVRQNQNRKMFRDFHQLAFDIVKRPSVNHNARKLSISTSQMWLKINESEVVWSARSFRSLNCRVSSYALRSWTLSFYLYQFRLLSFQHFCFSDLEQSSNVN